MAIDFYLVPNVLAGDNGGYVAKVFQTDVLDEKEFTREISITMGGIAEGQVANMLNAMAKIVASATASGRSVQTPLFSTSISVSGPFQTADSDYVEGVNFTHVNMRINTVIQKAVQTAPRRKHTGVNNMGPVIEQVIDKFDDSKNSSLHPGSLCRMTGARLKNAGDDANVGIYLIDAAGIETKVPAKDVDMNSPRAVSFIVPALPDGVYHLKVTTQYRRGREYGKPYSFIFEDALAVLA
ncbi:DUF4469 domain-containing protein [Breznakiellaceae bacterium SP9]